ncbi:hypothetical protein [Salipiger bermudensis]|uniref:hypothetical protein n=1 Tax=Salipiger bermudensis TaxID=344736 RepID=UPI001CD2D64D|nr:hypothetical protein [Salipiger bermudensis]MCA0963288.1 hypothetical protein [Salipiger bermudensis]
MKFTVLRPHQGDKWYDEGDEREAREADVAHLVERGVLAQAKPQKKAEPAAKNKARQVPSNKADQ